MVRLALLLDFVNSMDDCGMISPTELLPYVRKAQISKLAGQIHAYLAWDGHDSLPSWAFQLRNLDFEIIANRFLNHVDGDQTPLLCFLEHTRVQRPTKSFWK